MKELQIPEICKQNFSNESPSSRSYTWIGKIRLVRLYNCTSEAQRLYPPRRGFRDKRGTAGLAGDTFAQACPDKPPRRRVNIKYTIHMDLNKTKALNPLPPPPLPPNELYLWQTYSHLLISIFLEPRYGNYCCAFTF